MEHLDRARAVLDDLSLREPSRRDSALFLDRQRTPQAIDEDERISCGQISALVHPNKTCHCGLRMGYFDGLDPIRFS